MKLTDKVAIVTGGSRGIGKVIVLVFLREGAHVIALARSEEELHALSEETGNAGRLRVLRCDVSRSEDVQGAAAAVVKEFGKADILVNAAGVYGPIGPAESADLERWEETFAVNIFGTFAMIRAVLPSMVKARSGKIINFSGGGDGALPNFSAYSASKTAIVRLTETLAEELKPHGIDINVIAPGPVNTKFLEEALAAGEAAVGKKKYAEFVKQKESGGVPPEKTAELCVFLASPASDGLSGKFLSAVWDKWQEWDAARIKKIMGTNAYTLRRVKEDESR